MIINNKITKIVGGGYEIAEVRYMDSVVWHKPMIVENPCEKSCQTSCEKGCQSACEKSSQCGFGQGCYGQCRNHLCGNIQCSRSEGGDS